MTFGSAGAAGTLILDNSHDFHGTIVGLTEASSESAENHVDLTDLHYNPNPPNPSEQEHVYASFDSTDGDVTVTVTDNSLTL